MEMMQTVLFWEIKFTNRSQTTIDHKINSLCPLFPRRRIWKFSESHHSQSRWGNFRVATRNTEAVNGFLNPIFSAMPDGKDGTVSCPTIERKKT